jgi:hypothetical protein
MSGLLGTGSSYDEEVADEPRLITAAELDEMTPNERAEALTERIVTDWDLVPAAFREQVEATGARLAEQMKRQTAE